MQPSLGQPGDGAARQRTFPRRLSVEEAARLLRTSESVIRHELAVGGLPALDGVKGTVVDGRRLDAWLRTPHDPAGLQ